MHSLTTTQNHWGKNLDFTWIWKMICCKQGAGKKGPANWRVSLRWKPISASSLLATKPSFTQLVHFLHEKLYFAISWGLILRQNCGFVCFSDENGSQNKWQVVGMVSFHFTFFLRGIYEIFTDVCHRWAIRDCIMESNSSARQTFCLNRAECLHLPHSQKKQKRFFCFVLFFSF